MAIKVSGTTVIDDSRNLSNVVSASFSGTGAIILPSGTTAQRPSTSTAGMFRYNSTSCQIEFYDGVNYNTVVASTSAGGLTSTAFYLANA